MRSWLSERFAATLGASDKGDGVVANVKFHLPTVFARGSFGRRDDESWSHERVVALLFEFFMSRLSPEDASTTDGIGTFVATSGGPLSAAARLAGIFNKYASRRLGMLRAWATGRPSLMAVASEVGGEDSAPELAANDIWQYEAWRYVFEQIGETHPRMNDSLMQRNAQNLTHLLVFGFETLDHDSIQLMQHYGEATDVAVMLVSPSAALVRETKTVVASASGVKAPPIRRQGEICPKHLEAALKVPFHWYRSVRETLRLLALNGIDPEKYDVQPSSPANTLQRLQSVVQTGVKAEGDPSSDQSITLHLCHGKARQAEVAADAVIAALQDRNIRNLQLHEIAIVAPDVVTMAPHLQAAFGKTVTLEFEPAAAAALAAAASSSDDYEDLRKVQLPVVVADRSIGEMNDGAQFFLDLLSLIGGRVDKSSFFDLLQQSDFARLRGFGIEQLDRWWLMTERAGQRWAIDNQHRSSALDVVGLEVDSAVRVFSDKHTWLNTARRMLLGAIATRDTKVPSPQLVPIEDVDAEELRDVLDLLELIDNVSDAVREVSLDRNLSDWARVLGHHLRRLCNDELKFVRIPLAEIEELRRMGMQCDIPVSFDDVRHYLQGRFSVIPESSFRRDGRILVTNMASQHLVQRRVICVVGLDDSSLPAGAMDGNDLTGRQVVEGDTDPRHDLRRQLLDAIMSASDRVVLTCDGRSSKNNQKIDLITPLEELVEYAEEIGAPISQLSHPRHRLSAKNFLRGADALGSSLGVDGNEPWSFDVAARDIIVSSREEAKLEVPRPVALQVDLAAPLQLDEIQTMLTYPLSIFLKQQLKIYKEWDDEPIDYGTIPLELEREEFVMMLRQVLGPVGRTDNDLADEWRSRASLPLTTAAERSALESIFDARDGINRVLTRRLKGNDDENFPAPLGLCREDEFRLVLPSGHRIDHRIPILERGQTAFAILRPDKEVNEKSFGRFVDKCALEYLFALAAGVICSGWNVIAEVKDKKKIEWRRLEVTITGLPTEPAGRKALAAKWLDELVALWARAAAVPIPTFGTSRDDSVGNEFFVVGNREKAEDKFLDYVSKDSDYGTAFTQSDEALVFGAEPEFDDCFVAEVGDAGAEPVPHPAATFWKGRHEYWTITKPKKVRSVPRHEIELSVPSAMSGAAAANAADG
jgi:exodeoxyribonuclease V gamma subunit